MRVILNSDVIHTNRRWAKGLPPHIEKFCGAAKLAGAVLVLPRTVLLEDERHQTTLVNALLRDAEKALSALRDAEVEFPEIRIPQEMPNVTVVDALRAVGATVEVEDPNLDDYREAERRASLHLAPHPPEGKSDEMRDLVIWQVALRLATQDGSALIISRDEVHMHERGAGEAEQIKLHRAKNFEDALEILQKESPAEIQELLKKIGTKEEVRAPVRDAAMPEVVADREQFLERGARASRKDVIDARVLGFISFLGETSKTQLLGLMMRSGMAEIEANEATERLVANKSIVDTGHHFLVPEGQAGEIAAAAVELEVINLLEEG